METCQVAAYMPTWIKILSAPVFFIAVFATVALIQKVLDFMEERTIDTVEVSAGVIKALGVAKSGKAG